MRAECTKCGGALEVSKGVDGQCQLCGWLFTWEVPLVMVAKHLGNSDGINGQEYEALKRLASQS